MMRKYRDFGRLFSTSVIQTSCAMLSESSTKCFRNGQSLSNISPLRSRSKELVYERASAVLIFEFVSRTNTAKSEGLRRRAAHEILPRPFLEWTKSAASEIGMIRLIPREIKFFELFAELSSNLTEGAKLLRSILEDPRDLRTRTEQMQAIEHKGDKSTHAIITKLNQTFMLRGCSHGKRLASYGCCLGFLGHHSARLVQDARLHCCCPYDWRGSRPFVYDSRSLAAAA